MEEFKTWILKEFPANKLSLKRFVIQKYPVSNGAYRDYIACRRRSKVSVLPTSIKLKMPGDHPVWGCSKNDIDDFATWLGEIDGCTYRLPTEAEWEWAARGEEHLQYPWGDSFEPANCNTVESVRGKTVPVDAHAHAASPWGVCDLAGNVEEWTSDNYAPYPGGSWIGDDLFRHHGGHYPVWRGGSFLLGGDLARTARRHGPHYDVSLQIAGFRLVMEESS